MNKNKKKRNQSLSLTDCNQQLIYFSQISKWTFKWFLHHLKTSPFSITRFRSPHLYSQPSILQRLAIDRLELDPSFLQFQHYIRYSEPLELTATSTPLDLSVKTTPVPITPPCTPSPKTRTPLSPTPEVPSKKLKVNYCRECFN